MARQPSCDVHRAVSPTGAADGKRELRLAFGARARHDEVDQGEEPFEKEQIGSSAMAYKRNPMRSERINSLARFVMTLEENANLTHGVQFFERTLDDSANRRLVIPEMLLATDAVRLLMGNVGVCLEVQPARIQPPLAAAPRFSAT